MRSRARRSQTPTRCSPATSGTGIWCSRSPARDEPPRRVAILGNAAGTTSRAYEEFFPRTRVDGVEIDSELSEIGRRYFDMNNPRLHLYHEDARPFLRRIDARYDVISVDAYRQPYIPFYLTTVEFFETVRDRLAPAAS